MIMKNGIKIILLALQALNVFSSEDQLKYPKDCGWTPMHSNGLIVGGHVIKPDELSWIASLQYGNRHSFGHCGGSVINARYVLTAAHCVTGEIVQKLGELTGVRLGDFSQNPYCDYGSSNCTSYLHFGIAEKIVHKDYNQSSYLNDIALLRLNSRIPLSNVLRAVCLPNDTVDEPQNDEILIVSGWGNTMVKNESVAKRVVGVPRIGDPEVCELQDDSRMCAAQLSKSINTTRTACDGDSGGPLMQEFKKRRMMVEGIVSFVQGTTCVNPFWPTYFTRVRHYLKWIDEHMCIGYDCPTNTSVVENKFPIDCGYISNYGQSWLVSFRREKREFPYCVGVVINSRYVLTSAHCVSAESIRKKYGAISGVRLRDYDENGEICNNSTKVCTQLFGIDKITPHREYIEEEIDKKIRIVHNIALIRLDRKIPFGSKLKPICLPFGGNNIEEPRMGINLTIFRGRRYVDVAISNRDMCNSDLMWVDETNNCAIGTYRQIPEPGPLVHQFEDQRMVLDGIQVSAHYTFMGRKKGFSFKFIFDSVRNYGDWLDQNMEM